MFGVNSWVDGRFQVLGLCSDAGGMGTVMYVRDLSAGPSAPTCVLKFCKVVEPAEVARFRREVTTMLGFRDNPFVAQILHANLDHSPPYFVMPYFAEGDLLRHIDQIVSAGVEARLFAGEDALLKSQRTRGRSPSYAP